MWAMGRPHGGVVERQEARGLWRDPKPAVCDMIIYEVGGSGRRSVYDMEETHTVGSTPSAHSDSTMKKKIQMAVKAIQIYGQRSSAPQFIRTFTHQKARNATCRP